MKLTMDTDAGYWRQHPPPGNVPPPAAPDASALAGLASTLGMLFPQALRRRPDFRIDRIRLADGSELGVEETAIEVQPFCTLLHFRKPAGPQPRLLIIAPMSGHYASQLRETVLTMLPDHDVYLTDWHDARSVPLACGDFRLEDYTACLVRFLERLGAGAHVLAICQSCVPALCATALMAEDGHPARAASLTLMGGPIDARIHPTVVSRYANSAPLSWFESNVISTVPPGMPGAGRRVYAAELQLLSSFGMQGQRLAEACCRLWRDPFAMQSASQDLWRALSDAQVAAQDLAGEFYLDNLELVFREHALARGTMRCHGRAVRPEAIVDTALLTIEAELDDICGSGQTASAQRLCRNLPPALKRHHVQPGATHKGLFTGSSWTQELTPLVREHIRRAAGPLLRAGNA